MPVEFLSDQQAASFGRFTSAPSSRELARWCWLDDADRRMIGQHRRDRNRLGFAVQLAIVRMLGTFLPDPLDVPWSRVDALARYGIYAHDVESQRLPMSLTTRNLRIEEVRWQIDE